MMMMLGDSVKKKELNKKKWVKLVNVNNKVSNLYVR